MGESCYESWQGDRRVTHGVPQLRLSGRWLEACGFAIGDDLQISVGRGLLLIGRRQPGKG